jgi:hypothetical protein
MTEADKEKIEALIRDPGRSAHEVAPSLQAALAEIVSLREKLERAEADTRRLDGLDKLKIGKQVWEIRKRKASHTVELATFNGSGPTETVREAIDAAMSSSKEPAR